MSSAAEAAVFGCLTLHVLSVLFLILFREEIKSWLTEIKKK